jgi:Fe-S-cluster containining protein
MKSKPNAKPLNPEPPAAGPEMTLRQMVEACWASKDMMARIAEILAGVDKTIANMDAVCMGGGCCCKFDLAGHSLYISTAELALLCQSPPENLGRCKINRCPYQKNSRCLARSRRPLGCRTFFCKGDRSHAFSELYESSHSLIRQAHKVIRVAPYRYMDMISGVETLYSEDVREPDKM